MAKLYCVVVKVASEPLVGSVPPCAVVRYCEELRPSLSIRYWKNAYRSPLKLVMSPLVGRNEYTAFEPFEPEYRFLFIRVQISIQPSTQCLPPPLAHSHARKRETHQV